VVRRSGAPWRSFATRTSVRWPTTSRPSRIQPARRSSSARFDPSASAARRGAGASVGSRTRRSAPVRRANTTRRASRSPGGGGRRLPRVSRGAHRSADPPARPRAPDPAAAARPRAPSRSRTRTSTARAWRREPAIASASSIEPGTRTASHSRRTPRATASTGSRLRARSIQATSAPQAWASAAARRASVVAPLDPAPRRVTVPARGRPPAARSASSSVKPVGIDRSASRAGLRAGSPCSGHAGAGSEFTAGGGSVPPGNGTSVGRSEGP